MKDLSGYQGEARGGQEALILPKGDLSGLLTEYATRPRRG